MDDAIDIAIIDRVIKRMNLPDARAVVDPKVMQGRIDSVLLVIQPRVPSVFCKRIFETYFRRFHATERECLQAWALYYDYKSMEQDYQLGQRNSAKTWDTGGLEFITK